MMKGSNLVDSSLRQVAHFVPHSRASKTSTSHALTNNFTNLILSVKNPKPISKAVQGRLDTRVIKILVRFANEQVCDVIT